MEIRRFIVDLKAEHPPMRPYEIPTVCYVRFGRRPDYRTVERVLAEEAMPLRMVRRFAPYGEDADPRERRLAVVTLHADGWSAKAIAGSLRAHKSTVFRVLRRWAEEGPGVPEDRRPGRPNRCATSEASRPRRRKPVVRNPNWCAPTGPIPAAPMGPDSATPR